MRALGALLAVAAIGAVAAVVAVGRDRLVEPFPAETTAEPLEAPLVSDLVAIEPRGDVQQDAPPPLPRTPVRAVAPEIVAVPPVDAGSLMRIEPRGPLSPIGRAQDPADGPPEETILHRPMADAAGHFTAQGYRISLAGLVVTDVEQTCDGAGGEWPCGVHARTAFRRFLRGRALSCVVPPVPPEETLVIGCSLTGGDPAEWLVEQGWARAEPNGPYAELEQAAREAHRGLFGDAPAAPAPLTITLPETAPSLIPEPLASGG